ncbi:nitrilase-related carbon-nitrogen hydrolase, partial [candidate division KSB1 bacterium]
SLTGYCLREAVSDVALKLTDPLIEELLKASGDIIVIAGLVEESEEHLFYNSALFIDNGALTGVQRKVFLPNYGMFEESRYFAHGASADSFETHLGNIGILICEDTWHPRLAVDLADQNIKLLVNMSASPVKGIDAEYGISNRKINYDLNLFYARTFGIPVVFANKIGYEQGVYFWGGSALLLPDGSREAVCSTTGEELATADIELKEIRRSRISFPYLRDELSRELIQL